MDIVLSEEQVLLRDSLRRMLRDHYDFPKRQAISRSEQGMDRAFWHSLADMGVLAAPFGEEFGGSGLGPVATMVVAEEFGRSLVLEPYFESVTVVGGLIGRHGTEEQQQRYLPKIMSGEKIWALAVTEARSRHDFEPITTKATSSDEGFVLHGAKAGVPAAPWADYLIVSARMDQDGPSGAIGLFVIDRHAPNLDVRSFRTIDGRRASDLIFDGVLAEDVLWSGDNAVASLETARTFAIAAQSAEAVGAMDELVRITVEYAKTRKQFGVPIGSFQALQHRMVDMFIALQEAISVRNLLTQSLADGTATSALAAATKAKIGEAARYVGEQAVQIHGGMGMSDELIVGHYLKRLTAINIQFGDPTYHYARFARMAATTADKRDSRQPVAS
jgi:alkylation response protein AidB-like acyl-CoA dehydrogenase